MWNRGPSGAPMLKNDFPLCSRRGSRPLQGLPPLDTPFYINTRSVAKCVDVKATEGLRVAVGYGPSVTKFHYKPEGPVGPRFGEITFSYA